MAQQPRVLIYGAGVIGSVYALRMAKAGFDVSVLARADRLRALREGGLRLRHAILGEDERAEVRVIERVDAQEPFDLAVVSVRADQIPAVLRDLASSQAQVVAVIGNNVAGHADQEAIVGASRLVLGFGAYGGYREDGAIVYLDGRTPKAPARLSGTTLGIRSPQAQASLERAEALLARAALPVTRSPDIVAWLQWHAAVVLPLAAAIYATGGDQERLCRTRDAIVLGIRAVREVGRSLRRLGVGMQPKRLRTVVWMPEPLLATMVSKGLRRRAAGVAVFGHAKAPGGRAELAKAAQELDALARRAGQPLPSWDRLLPYFPAEHGRPLIADGARSLRLRLW